MNSYSIMALPRLDNSEQLASDMMSSSLVVSSPSSPLMTSSPLVTSSVTSSVTVFCVSQLLGCDLIATLLKFFQSSKVEIK